MHHLTTFAVLMATLGQISLALSLLLMRVRNDPVALPLIVFFVSSAIVVVLPTLGEFWLPAVHYGLAIALPAFLLQPVSLWLYVEGLTWPTPWRPARRHLLHLLPVGLGLLGSAMLCALPRESLHQVFTLEQEPETGFATLVIIYAFSMMVLWMLQSGVYLFSIFRQLGRYREQLKRLFASNEHRELFWLSWLSAVVGGTWLLSFAYLLPSFDNKPYLFGPELIAAVYFILVWSLSVWGLRQKPGFANRYLDAPTLALIEEVEVPEDVKPKYQKSALDEVQYQRITAKLENAMASEKLFLESGLSLTQLAARIGVPANYLSQTLNQSVGETFFDYINRWRISYSLDAVKNAQTSILDIAMNSGFNARSSFYKAFKRETGMTPGEFRALPSGTD